MAILLAGKKIKKSYSPWAGYTTQNTPAVKRCLTVIPVGGRVATLLWISLAELNLQISLLFPQVPTEGWQLSDHFLLTIWSKQREWGETDRRMGTINVIYDLQAAEALDYGVQIAQDCLTL